MKSRDSIMRSDTQQMPTRYLHSVLLDGAKPFLYRSGVRSLLGIPDSEGDEIVFSPTTPPVGFDYANSQFMREPYIPQYSPDLTVSSALGMQGVGLESPEELVKLSQAEESGENGVMPTGVAQQSATTPESGQQSVIRPASEPESISVEPSEMPERPGTAFPRATIDIPGTSERSQDFPSLALPEQTEPLSNKAEEQSQPQLSPKEPRSSSIARLLSEDSSIPSLFTPSPLPGEGRDWGRRSDEAFYLSSTVASSFNPHPNPPPPRGRPVNRLPTMREYIRSEGQKAEIPSTPTINAAHSSKGLPQIDPGKDNGPIRAAADRIEQLRHAVHELAAKKSPQREQTQNETPPQQQPLPPPLQQIVIVSRPSSQARIPSAFWERSYLGRIRARILR